MLNVLEFRTGVLAPTKTYARRSWCWIPADRDNPEWDKRLGNLTIKLQHAKSGVRRAIEVDTYAIEEDLHPEPGDHGGRAFWLYNLTDPEQEEPYRCVVGGLTPHCKCKAGKCRAETDKHLDTLTHLVETGIIDGIN